MIIHLLNLEASIKLHEQLDRIRALLSATDWPIVRLLKPVMEPLMRVQKLLEGETYVTDRLAVPYTYNLREGLNKVFVDLRRPASADSRDRAKAKSSVVPCVEALMEDFNRRWGSGKNVLLARSTNGDCAQSAHEHLVRD